jgi:hypothetical protein
MCEGLSLIANLNKLLKNLARGEKTVTVSGYWQKPLTVSTLAVIKFH